MRDFAKLGILVVGFGLFGAGCGDDDKEPEPTQFELTSPAFESGDALPLEYTCHEKDFPFSGMPPVDHTLPELHWTAGPAGTQSYAIVFKDVTLTTATPMNELGYHWAIYNIPPNVRSLPEALESGNPIPSVPSAKQYSGPLFNDGYLGPCPSWAVAEGSPLLGMDPPPMVSTDSYTFTVFAMPAATITEPAMRTRAEGGPPVSYVRDLDDVFIADALAKAELRATSDAQPARFVPPS